MTKSMALDYASRNILINAVAPGFIDTELTSSVLGKDGMNEIAMAYLLGDWVNQRRLQN